MKIEVGEYVRTKYGITQYKEYETTNGNKLLCMPVKDGSNGIFANIEDIIKSSPNIIDLIEVGDYVNRHLVVDVDNINKGAMREIYCEDDEEFGLWNENIETIVTKQQFENMEYKINE